MPKVRLLRLQVMLYREVNQYIHHHTVKTYIMIYHDHHVWIKTRDVLTIKIHQQLGFQMFLPANPCLVVHWCSYDVRWFTFYNWLKSLRSIGCRAGPDWNIVFGAGTYQLCLAIRRSYVSQLTFSSRRSTMDSSTWFKIRWTKLSKIICTVSGPSEYSNAVQ